MADAGLSKFPTPDTDWHWRFTVLKAEILLRQRRNEASLKLLEGTLPPTLASSDIAVWRDMTQGMANAFLGQFPVAKDHLATAEALARSKHPTLLGEVYLRYGTLAFLSGDLPAAAAAYHAALQISREQKDDFLQAAALGSLGLVATKQEHYDESIDWNQGALRLSQLVGAENSTAIILGNMGWSYMQLGNYENALALLRQAEEASTKAGLLGARAYWRINIARVEYFLRDYDGSEKDTQVALGFARELSEKPVIAQCLNNLSYVEIARQNLDQAVAYNKEAVEIARTASDKYEGILSDLITARIELARGQYEAAKHDLLKVLRDASAGSAIRWEADISLAKAFDQQGDSTKAESEYRRAIDTFETARHSISEDELRLTFLSNVIDFYDDYVNFLVRRGRFEDALRVADHTRSQTLAEGLAAGQPTPALRWAPREIARTLRSTLLLYWLGQNQSYLWIITPSRIACIPLPKRDQIEPLVKAYREEVTSGKDPLESGSKEGQELYAELVAPADKFVGKNSRVILLPGEGLYGLNFETLIVPQPAPHYWLEDVTVCEAGSLALLSFQNRRGTTFEKAEKSLLLIGNTQQANPDFPPLVQAPIEMRRVAAHFSSHQCEVLEGSHATASAYLRSDPGRFNYLHFVTHGIASKTRPLESAVILSREGDSYKLYARDILAHPLNAQLVTISACNGAGTRAYAGEGLVGLSWAFLRAGAHNVVASLWEVSDASSTTDLMDSFYTELGHGEDPATALRNAKLGILKSNHTTVFSKPFYWAPFQLYVGS
ncbi:MAG TPA: CHAT domain-containing protein [Candidatus Sulfotelmatobacter sp.]|nr:CHAT domain-containing protein [Candidatus Sulfotelmatobacter sp.]